MLHVRVSLKLPVSRYNALFVLLALLPISCNSSGLQPLSGQVLYKGQPAKGAVVVFHPKGDSSLETLRATGVTQDDGTFKLTTGDTFGINPGSYVVTIFWPDDSYKPAKTKGTEPPPSPPDRLQGKYANQTNSPLQVEVKSGMYQLAPFKLE